jgi:hypothetical protein
MASCTQKVVCPAYQSAFIYDKDALRKKYSYFNEDSTPKVYTVSRNKYLIGVPVSYKKKERSLQTVAMVAVNPVVPDSLQEGYDKKSVIDSLDVSGIERNVNDSTAVLRIDTLETAPQDSTYMISKEREIRILKYNAMKRSYFVDTVGFNTEQDNYMWYLRDVLVLPDARLSMMGAGKGEEAQEGKAGEKVKKGGFFKNLFKKKEKEEVAVDSTQQQLVQEQEDYGYDDFEGKAKDSTAVDEQQQPVTPEKKSKESKRKKSDKKKKTEPPPAKKEEDEGDGF